MSDLITSRATGALVMPRLLRKRIVFRSLSAGKSFEDLQGLWKPVTFALRLCGALEFPFRGLLKIFEVFFEFGLFVIVNPPV